MTIRKLKKSLICVILASSMVFVGCSAEGLDESQKNGISDKSLVSEMPEADYERIEKQFKSEDNMVIDAVRDTLGTDTPEDIDKKYEEEYDGENTSDLNDIKIGSYSLKGKEEDNGDGKGSNNNLTTGKTSPSNNFINTCSAAFYPADTNDSFKAKDIIEFKVLDDTTDKLYYAYQTLNTAKNKIHAVLMCSDKDGKKEVLWDTFYDFEQKTSSGEDDAISASSVSSKRPVLFSNYYINNKINGFAVLDSTDPYEVMIRKISLVDGKTPKMDDYDLTKYIDRTFNKFGSKDSDIDSDYELIDFCIYGNESVGSKRKYFTVDIDMSITNQKSEVDQSKMSESEVLDSSGYARYLLTFDIIDLQGLTCEAVNADYKDQENAFDEYVKANNDKLAKGEITDPQDDFDRYLSNKDYDTSYKPMTFKINDEEYDLGWFSMDGKDFFYEAGNNQSTFSKDYKGDYCLKGKNDNIDSAADIDITIIGDKKTFVSHKATCKCEVKEEITDKDGKKTTKTTTFEKNISLKIYSKRIFKIDRGYCIKPKGSTEIKDNYSFYSLSDEYGMNCDTDEINIFKNTLKGADSVKDENGDFETDEEIVSINSKIINGNIYVFVQDKKNVYLLETYIDKDDKEMEFELLYQIPTGKLNIPREINVKEYDPYKNEEFSSDGAMFNYDEMKEVFSSGSNSNPGTNLFGVNLGDTIDAAGGSNPAKTGDAEKLLTKTIEDNNFDSMPTGTYDEKTGKFVEEEEKNNNNKQNGSTKMSQTDKIKEIANVNEDDDNLSTYIENVDKEDMDIKLSDAGSDVYSISNFYYYNNNWYICTLNSGLLKLSKTKDKDDNEVINIEQVSNYPSYQFYNYKGVLYTIGYPDDENSYSPLNLSEAYYVTYTSMLNTKNKKVSFVIK